MTKATVEEIKEIFPDLGVVFIQACIDIYKGKKSRIVDGLLTNNLHPVLLLMDRKMDKLMVYQDREKAVTEDYQGMDDDARFKEEQIQRVQAMEADAEYNFKLKYGTAQQQVNDEYNDDYDDQYEEVDLRDTLKVEVEDDLSLMMKSKLSINKRFNEKDHDTELNGKIGIGSTASIAKPSTSASIGATVSSDGQSLQQQSRSAARRERRAKNRAVAAGKISAVGFDSKAGDTNAVSVLSKDEIHQQMADMKRLNKMTMEEEREAEYWDQMRNTNHDLPRQPGKDQWKRELEKAQEGTELPETNDSTGATNTQKTNQHQIRQTKKSQSNTKSAEDGGEGGGKKKPRTKTHDKHHQRDRAIKKTSHFTPTG